MARIWKHDGKIVMRDGKVLLCDDCPCGGKCRKIGSSQIDGDSRSDPHYRVKIAHFTTSRAGTLYAYGHADDCLEVIGGGKRLFSDHSLDESGVTHSYAGALCKVPANCDVTIYLWDTARLYIKWDGEFWFCWGDASPDIGMEDFE